MFSDNTQFQHTLTWTPNYKHILLHECTRGPVGLPCLIITSHTVGAAFVCSVNSILMCTQTFFHPVDKYVTHNTRLNLQNVCLCCVEQSRRLNQRVQFCFPLLYVHAVYVHLSPLDSLCSKMSTPDFSTFSEKLVIKEFLGPQCLLLRPHWCTRTLNFLSFGWNSLEIEVTTGIIWLPVTYWNC